MKRGNNIHVRPKSGIVKKNIYPLVNYSPRVRIIKRKDTATSFPSEERDAKAMHPQWEEKGKMLLGEGKKKTFGRQASLVSSQPYP